MRGDQADFVSRLRLTLPEGWFADEAPVLQGVLAGFGSAWEWAYKLLQSVRQQSRLATVAERFLELACADFFGSRLQRRGGESDDALRARLRQAMLRLRGTRAVLLAVATDAGIPITVFEPERPADTGAYNIPGNLAYGVAGGWGSLQMPLECLVTLQGAPSVAEVGPELADVMPAGGVAWMRVAA